MIRGLTKGPPAQSPEAEKARARRTATLVRRALLMVTAHLGQEWKDHSGATNIRRHLLGIVGVIDQEWGIPSENPLAERLSEKI